MDLSDVDSKYTVMCSERTLQEEPKGFFQSLFDVFLQNTNVNEWLLSTWIKNVHGLDFITEFLKEKESSMKLDEIFSVQPMNRKKNLETSIKAKELGTKELQAGNFQSALSFFNQSIIFCPVESQEYTQEKSPLLQLLWLRSECLIKLNMFRLALIDLQIAIKADIPTEHKGLFLCRQGECYKKLCDMPRARISYNLALKFLNDNSSSYQSIKKELCLINDDIKLNKKQDTQKIIINEDNRKEQHEIQELMEINKSEEMGRFVVACKNISIGDKVLAEDPYAACLKFNFYGTNCYHCFKRLQISYGCSTCANLAFCSPECRDIAIESYHKYECNFMDLFIGSGMSILCIIAMRMVTQLGLQKSLQVYDKYFVEESSESDSNNICDKERLIYNLCTHTKLRDPIDYLKRFVMGFFLLKCLEKSNFFSEELTEVLNDHTLTKEKEKILALLLHNIQMLQFNAHEIEELQPVDATKSNKIVTRAIGVGIYPTVSLFNHDCHQGVARYFIGKKIVIRALKNIKAGCMIPENYGPIFTKRTKYARQRVLRSRYWFKCQCNACTEIWPDLDQLQQNKLLVLRCLNKNCEGKINGLSADNDLECAKCGTSITVDHLLKIHMNIEELCLKKYKNGQTLMESHKHEEAMKVFTDALKYFYESAYPPHHETHIAEQNLRLCIIALHKA